MTATLPPYYHPTTVCFIDDNFSFLNSLSLDLPDDWPFISYLDPKIALAAVNQPDLLPPLVDRCFSMDNSDPAEPLIHLNLGALEQEIKLVHRFRRLSVLMVDYAMPNMSGLEFCERVENPNLKKVLLTGVADEKTAVAAFNKGIIDHYVPKHSLATVNELIPFIEKLKRGYFDQYSARLTSNLALNPPAFMTEPAIASYFEKVLRKFNIVEYYLASDPYGYLLLRADGSMVRLVVLCQEELDQQILLAQRYEAPARLVRRMQAGKLIGYLYEHPEDYMGHEVYPWREALIAAKRIEGKQTWYVGVAKNPPVDVDFDASESSYEQFLRLERPVV
jgi:CheY-like chemotaxis protein